MCFVELISYKRCIKSAFFVILKHLSVFIMKVPNCVLKYRHLINQKWDKDSQHFGVCFRDYRSCGWWLVKATVLFVKPCRCGLCHFHASSQFTRKFPGLKFPTHILVASLFSPFSQRSISQSLVDFFLMSDYKISANRSKNTHFR